MRCVLLIFVGFGAVTQLYSAPPAEKRPGGRLVLPVTPPQKKLADTVLVKVNGESITVPDLQWGFQLQKVPLEHQRARQREVLEKLVDERLLQQFLKSRKIAANPEEVADRLDRFKIAAGIVPESDRKPTASRNPTGYAFDEEQVRGEISGALAWQKYLEVAISQQTIRERFQKHQQQFDGTEMRASHIVILVATERESDELQAAEDSLRTLRNEIVQRKLTFADAARKHSHGPSREQGGDVGFFPFRGKMPAAFCDVAFRLKEGEISQPFRTPFGVHLCVVTARKPGELSLEDARPGVWRTIAREIREQRIAELRKEAKIEWVAEPEQKPLAKP